MIRCLLVILAVTMGAKALAQDENPLFGVLQDHTYPLGYGPDGVSDEGGDYLNARAREAGLVGFGEQHATADIALFARAWFHDLREFGFDHAVIEVGPWSTQSAEALLRGRPGAFENDAASRADGLAYPFLFFQEEADLARDMVQSHQAKGPALWGVDQEFVASGSILADRLEHLARTEAQSLAVTDFRSQLEQSPWLVGAGSAEDFSALQAAFAQGEPEAIALIGEIIRSNRIYAPFMGREGSVYAANLEREQGMKRYFLHAWEQIRLETGDNPEIFLKFGGNHLMRGLSATNVPSLGNFISEWSLSEGIGFFNIMVDCHGGYATDPRTGEPVPCESYFNTQGTMFEGVADEGPVVIDLAALRPLASSTPGLDENARQLIFAFDAYVVLPDVSGATPIQPVP